MIFVEAQFDQVLAAFGQNSIWHLFENVKIAALGFRTVKIDTEVKILAFHEKIHNIFHKIEKNSG